MTDSTTKPKKTISPELTSFIYDYFLLKREAALWDKKIAREEAKKKRADEKVQHEIQKQAEKQQTDRLKFVKKDGKAKDKIKKELEQLKTSMGIEITPPFKKLPQVAEEKEPEEIKEPEPETVQVIEEIKPKEPEPEPEPEKPKKTKKEAPKKLIITPAVCDGQFRAKVKDICDNMPDKHTADIFKTVSDDYDFNKSVDENMNILMSKAIQRIQDNKETLEKLKEKKTVKAVVKAEKTEEELKKEKMLKLKARYLKLSRH